MIPSKPLVGFFTIDMLDMPWGIINHATSNFLSTACAALMSFKLLTSLNLGRVLLHVHDDAVCTMLAGAHLESQFWPYSFYHFLHLYNVTPHHSHSPFTICSGHLPDLSFLCTFGCWVYVLLPHATSTHHNKLRTDTPTGIFLGYFQTVQDILYYDLNSHQVKTALHLASDDGMTDLKDKTPNAWLLCGNTVLPKEILDLTCALQYIDISPSPFTTLVNIEMQYEPSDQFPFGIQLATYWLYPNNQLSLSNSSAAGFLSIQMLEILVPTIWYWASLVLKPSIWKRYFWTVVGVIFWKKVNGHNAFLRENRKQQTYHWWYKYLIPNFVITVEESGKQ